MNIRPYMNWSGGKDSALALYKARRNAILKPDLLLTNVNKMYERVSMHGVRKELLIQQAYSLNMELKVVELPEDPSMAAYEKITFEKINDLKKAGYNAAIFGDIFLEDLKIYREQQLAKSDVECFFPLWKSDTKLLMKEFLALNFKTIVVCVNENYLDKSFCGRIVDEQFLNDLPANVDPCGENGEFHTFVFDSPDFKTPLKFEKGEVVHKKYTAPKIEKDNCFTNSVSPDLGFYFCDLLPV